MDFQHGEWLVKSFRWGFIRTQKKLKSCYRFRQDPVPFYGHRRGIGFTRRVKTFQERKLYCKYGNDFVRGKRRPKYLPDGLIIGYSIAIFHEKRSWKRTKKKKQWM